MTQSGAHCDGGRKATARVCWAPSGSVMTNVPPARSRRAVVARRSAHYPDVPDFHTNYGSLLLAYEYHSDPWMGRGH